MLSRVIPDPTICPVPLDILRKHCYVDQNYSDELLSIYGRAATAIAESATNRLFLQRSVQWTLTPDTRQSVFFSLAVTLQNYFNTYQRPWLHCPHSAVSVDAMSIGTWGMTDALLIEGTDFESDCFTDPARVRLLNFDEFAPNVDHLTITYTSGYGATGEDVPMPIWQAIMLLVARMFEQRGDQDAGVWSSGAEALLAPYTVLQFGAASDLYSA